MSKNEYNYEQMQREVMSWYGWGSPIGLTVFFVGIGVCAILIRCAICGF